MCGIIYAKRDKGKAVKKFVEEAYRTQKSRGSEGFGFVGIYPDGTYVVERDTFESSILRKLHVCNAPEILFHHRLPTSTQNLDFCTHPILVDNAMLDKKYLVVHNGVVSAPGELKAKHESLGFVYTTDHKYTHVIEKKGKEPKVVFESEKFNDSETLAIEFALFLEGKIDSLRYSGTSAVVVVEIKKETDRVEKVHFGRNTGNPLVTRTVGHKKGNVSIISSAGGGVEVEAGVLNTIDKVTDTMTNREVDIGQTYKAYRYQPYASPYFGRDDHSRMGFKDKNLPATISLPTPKQAKEDDLGFPVIDYSIKDEIDRLEEELEEVDTELQYWRGEFIITTDASTQQVLREEMTSLEVRRQRINVKLDELYTEEYSRN